MGEGGKTPFEPFECFVVYLIVELRTPPPPGFRIRDTFNWPAGLQNGRLPVVKTALGANAMKIAMIIGSGLLLAAGTAAFGQASLPTFYSGPWKAGPLPTGWTAYGLRSSDYADNYDGVDGNAGGLDTAGDWIKINFASAPSTVSYWLKGNSLSGDYTFKVQESVNGSTWTDMAVFNSGNPIPNSPATQYTNNLLSSSRHVQFIYVTRAAGNVGIDGVRIAGPGVPSVSFNPNGTTNAPVSNLFSMAVSISPSGSGMQSWNMTPSYSGTASLTAGSFTFTPATADQNKTFTVRVIATNSIGTTTGTATVVVTPYTAPVPVITLSPAAPYSIMATETQKLGIGAAPAGSGISGWTLLPSNYAGSATMVGTNFTFTTAAADGPATYMFTVLATNLYGTSTGTAEITVAEYVKPPPPGSVIVTFEDGPSKTAYSPTTNTISGRSWLLGGVIGTLENDKKFDLKALRIRCNEGDDFVKLCSLTPFASGIESISLWFASYGNDGTNNMPQVSIQISTNLATGWVTLDTIDTGSAANLAVRVNSVGVNVPVYFRLWAPVAGNDKRANIDNIAIAPYVAPTGYDAFLLKYNVTPGDPGTAPGDDLDGDTHSNTNEFNADSNPYDPASVP